MVRGGEETSVAQVHSILVRAGREPCAVTGRLAAPHLRQHVAGYSAFRSGSDAAGRRVLPLSLVVLIVDLAGMKALVSGPHDTAVALEETGWRQGVAIGLTPDGVQAILGLPMRDLAGTIVPLADVLGSRAEELVDRLEATSGWASRFALLDGLFTAWRQERRPDTAAALGWRRLQKAGGRIKISELAAELGVGRRRLETGFAREIGQSPKTVARIARFQDALQVLATPSAGFGTAAACGFADQPHFNREIRAMAGITPTELRAFVQYTDRLHG
jgi:AraC-like DNA-binding protein